MAGSGRFPVIDPLDRRLVAWRPDLADARLEGQVQAERFVKGEPRRVALPVADLRAEPRPDCPIDHQLLLGEPVALFEEREGWAWVQARTSGYVGWMRADGLAADAGEPTHVVCVPRTFLYPEADLKQPALACLSMRSLIAPVGSETARGTDYLLLDDGSAVVDRHVRLRDRHDTDFVSVARRFLGTPYLWGGASGLGLDCSGLIHLAMAMCGRSAPRDSDMQAAGLGAEIDPGVNHSGLRRGDLVFWRGHVAIVEGDGNLLHANGYTMDVTSEPFGQAVERIATLFEHPIGYRRPSAASRDQ